MNGIETIETVRRAAGSSVGVVYQPAVGIAKRRLPQAFSKLTIDCRFIIVVADVERAGVLGAVVLCVLLDEFAGGTC